VTQIYLKRTLVLAAFLLGALSFASGQSSSQAQELARLPMRVNAFYKWYINLISTNRLSEDFNPVFVQKKDGMTTLDFKNYRRYLRKFDFSDEYIRRKVDDFRECITNLEATPFSMFSKNQDLDDYEALGCAFNNRYEWFDGGMEPAGGADPFSVRLNQDGTAVVTVLFYDEFLGQRTNRNSCALITFAKKRKVWLIVDMAFVNYQNSFRP
jgi:hypothetical protein